VQAGVSALDLSNLDAAVSSRATQASVDSFFDVFIEFQEDGSEYLIDSFFDIFTELSAMEARVNARLDDLAAQLTSLIELIESTPGVGPPGGGNGKGGGK
jgi:hypothetical protein